ncbi:MAG: hypothetical protein ACJAVM_003097 [Sulfitobacter sp.]|jgi:hypothetical protein
MLIFLRHHLAFLAVPKTGTTAVEMALRPKAEVVFARNRKHITAQRYMRKIGPFLKDTFGVFPEPLAVMRDPVDQIRSWYKYRTSERLNGSDLSTAEISFDDFVRAVIADDPPAFAQIGSQHAFLTDGAGQLQVDHLFAYDQQLKFRQFLSDRIGEPVQIKPKNISPEVPAPLGAEVAQMLRRARADEFALYDRLIAAGGALHQPRT